MELAKVTTRSQITIPKEIRKKLNLKEGDKVVFIEENGKIVIENSAMFALRQIQNEFKGEAEKAGLKNEQEVVDLVKEIRKEMWEKRHANNG